MDDEGGHRFEMVNEHIVQIREDSIESLSQTEQALLEQLAYLEIRFERLEPRMARIEMERDVSPVAHQEPNPQNYGCKGN